MGMDPQGQLFHGHGSCSHNAWMMCGKGAGEGDLMGEK